jgi:7-cyano-7-deazaguanine synthase
LDHMTVTRPNAATVGLLLSGGLDSGILLGQLLKDGRRVQPFYVRCGLVWEEAELRAVRAILSAVPELGRSPANGPQPDSPLKKPESASLGATAGRASSGTLLQTPALEPLVVLEMPLGDVYGNHWSVSGRDTPGADSADDAVYLPGRNAILTLKPALWCVLHGVEELALAILASNPFADATDRFFRDFATAIEEATQSRLRFTRPLSQLAKKDVMELGRGFPLELTFSCIAPVDGLHCGQCNKCAERQQAFRSIGAGDPTQYASCETNTVGGRG